MSFILGLDTATEYIRRRYIIDKDCDDETYNILCDICDAFEEMIEEELDRMHEAYEMEQQ